MAQWLRLYASKTGGIGSVPGQRTKIPRTAWHNQKVKIKKEANIIKVFGVHNDFEMYKGLLRPKYLQTATLQELMPIELVMSSNHLILCRPLLLLPSICPSISVKLFTCSSNLLSLYYIGDSQMNTGEMEKDKIQTSPHRKLTV